jgi:hypothetical protein
MLTVDGTMKTQFEIKNYPAKLLKWEKDRHGSRIAEIATINGGVVKVFSFPGNEKIEAFTSLETYLEGDCYHATLPRHYHDRWIGRLAEDFAFDVARTQFDGGF